MVRNSPPRGNATAREGTFWLYGLHAVRAALANPHRTIKRAVVTERALADLKGPLSRVRHETLAPDALSRLLPSGAVHQGAALLCDPLPALDLETVLTA